jgi:hypothetical protein
MYFTHWVREGNESQRTGVQNLALNGFRESMKASRDVYEATNGAPMSEEELNEFLDDYELGQKMLRNYFAWAPNHDMFRVLAVEWEFEIPIGVTADGEQVVYKGRIDMVIEDDWGDVWIVDHKTIGRREDTVEYLELDEQLGSYAWAWAMLKGQTVAGCIYNQLYKGTPEPPARNINLRQGRWYSVNKQQDTTYELYLKTLQEAGEPLEPYGDMLDYLKYQSKQYFIRTQVHRSVKELKNLGKQIELEAIDMLDNPSIYPNPNKWHCKWCSFREPCLATNDDSDVNWILNTNYHKETPLDRPIDIDEANDGASEPEDSRSADRVGGPERTVPQGSDLR